MAGIDSIFDNESNGANGASIGVRLIGQKAEPRVKSGSGSNQTEPGRELSRDPRRDSSNEAPGLDLGLGLG